MSDELFKAARIAAVVTGFVTLFIAVSTHDVATAICGAAILLFHKE